MTKTYKAVFVTLAMFVILWISSAQAVAVSEQSVPIDPTRNLAASAAPRHTLLPEEYIWTEGDVTARRPDHHRYPWNRPDLRVAPHFFRARFNIAALPAHATLYVAGPREAHVYLNGHRVDDFYSNIDEPIGFHVFHADAVKELRPGDNVLAIEAVRGRGIVTGTASLATQQLAYGEVLVAKLIPAAFGVEAPALVSTGKSWRSSSTGNDRWFEPAFDDSAWLKAESLGPIESDVDFFQWSADAGMYGWPGYRGMSSSLRTFPLSAAAVTHVFSGSAVFANTEALTHAAADGRFTVKFAQNEKLRSDADAPSLLLDFGREISGRLLVESSSPVATILSIAYGESEIEAMATGLSTGQQGGNYLGTNVLEVPANGVARGPKSGFRYVRIRFLKGAPTTEFRSIRVEGIYYPVEYKGSFESSDPLLNRIWETGAYTAHLCMQDGIWDAPKRDRGRWVGDLDVEGRVISTAFGDSKLTEETLRTLVPEGSGDVNGIPGYSALWVTSLLSLYQHSGDEDFVRSQHDGLLRILATMDTGLDGNGLFTNTKHQWLFVDWSPGLYAYTPASLLGTQLQYIRAYRVAVVLLGVMGDEANAGRYRAQASKALAAVHTLRDKNGATYGNTWQLNALAALVDDSPQATLWSDVFSHVKQDAPNDQVISPYFNAYLLDAMAMTGHRREALEWLRTYWGGMLAEGATSFWESYDLRWPKNNFHLSLQADGTSGYFVSLAHGWSSGPTAWLAENVLGVREPVDGYRSVTIAPDLAGLDWARGTVPTPHGVIAINIDRKKGIALDLPDGIEHAFVVQPIGHAGEHLYINGTAVADSPMRTTHFAELTRAGHYEITLR
jgi:alpha-L-rhamnosidase